MGGSIAARWMSLFISVDGLLGTMSAVWMCVYGSLARDEYIMGRANFGPIWHSINRPMHCFRARPFPAFFPLPHPALVRPATVCFFVAMPAI